MAVFTDEQINEILSIFRQNLEHRQYIGARYVPIFGRVGETSIEWDNSAPYEPLTIVLHQGNSFTSRQYVPAGIDINDTRYWANTGNFNAQVEQYRQEVLRVSNDLTEKIPIDDFSSTHTVLDALTNDAAAEANFLVYVDAVNGIDTNTGTEDNPVKTIQQALTIAKQNNRRDIRVYLQSAGTYDFGDLIRLTNLQLHVYSLDTDADTVLNIPTITIYNSYIHIEGQSVKPLIVNWVSGHQDVGGIYFRYCTFNLTAWSMSWCGISVYDSELNLLSPTNANYSMTKCDVQFSNTAINHMGFTGGYWRMFGGSLDFRGGVVFGGNTARTIGIFYIENVVWNFSAAISASEGYTVNFALISSHNSYGYAIPAAYTSAMEFCTGLVSSTGVYVKSDGLIELQAPIHQQYSTPAAVVNLPETVAALFTSSQARGIMVTLYENNGGSTTGAPIYVMIRTGSYTARATTPIGEVSFTYNNTDKTLTASNGLIKRIDTVGW